MKKIIAGILCGAMLLGSGITVKAESLPVKDISLSIPESVVEDSENIGNELELCPELLQSIAYYESRFSNDAQNGNCIGLMQINPDIHKERLSDRGWTKDDLYNSYINMYIAGEILAELFDRYEDPGEVILRYNGATSALKEYKMSGKLSTYANNVLALSEKLERQHQK